MRTAGTADRGQLTASRLCLVLLTLVACCLAVAQAQIKPAQVFSLSRWSLQTPISDGSSILSVKQPELGTYSSSNFNAKDDPALNPRKRVYFVTPANGAKTPNSNYPRTELREMKTDGTTQASWSLGSSTVRTLTFTGAVTQLAPVRRRVCIAQVKGGSNEPLEIMVEAASCSSGTSCSGIAIRAWLGDNAERRTVASSYTLGTKYTISIRAGNNRIKITYNGEQVADYPLPATYRSGTGYYFKVGNYLQTNTSYDAATAKSVVWVSSVSLNSP